MKVHIRNLSNKQRSVAAMNELKVLAIQVATEFGIDNKIDLIQLNYTKSLLYYRKGKPMYGFHRLFHNHKVRIDFAQNWDTSQDMRKRTIVHEMTHVKQMIEKRLVIKKDLNGVKWKGKINESWRNWRWKKFDELDGLSQKKYIKKCLPWESEVHLNVSKFIK